LPDWVGYSNGMIWVSLDSIFSCDLRSDHHMTLLSILPDWVGCFKWDDMRGVHNKICELAIVIKAFVIFVAVERGCNIVVSY